MAFDPFANTAKLQRKFKVKIDASVNKGEVDSAAAINKHKMDLNSEIGVLAPNEIYGEVKNIKLISHV